MNESENKIIICLEYDNDYIAIQLRESRHWMQRTEQWAILRQIQEQWPKIRDITFLVKRRIPVRIAIQLLVSYPNLTVQEVSILICRL